MKIKSWLILTLLSALSVAVTAQWQWTDPNGRRVFSDRPPPPEIPAGNILKQPMGRAVTAQPAASAASAPSSAASVAAAPRLSGKDKALEEKKKQAEAAEAERKKAEEEKFQKTRADNCSRARQVKASFDSGARIATVDAKGERVILDEGARAAETKRLQDVIQSECK